MNAVRNYWFLISLAIILPGGAFLGMRFPTGFLPDTFNLIPTRWCTAAILFLMAVTLDSRKLWTALKAPKPVAVACAINQVFLPLACLPLLLLPWSDDIAIGLLIATSVPCTMAAASVWTRKAGGNDAVSLLVTLLTNALCFVVAPFWLWVGHNFFGVIDAAGTLDFPSLVIRLIQTALVPATCGQLLRISHSLRHVVDSNRPILSNTAQAIILLLVLLSVFRGGNQFSIGSMAENLRHLEFLSAWICCISLHAAALYLAWIISRRLQLDESDTRACVIAGSQKTLPIGIVLSNASGLPFSILPMLMFHASQLVIDTFVAARLKQTTATQHKQSSQKTCEQQTSLTRPT